MKVDIVSILFVAVIGIVVVLTYGISAIFGLIAGIIMFLLIRLLGEKIALVILGFEFNSFVVMKKAKIKDCVLFNLEFRGEHKGFYGIIKYAMSITWIGFGVALLFMRFFIESFATFVQQGLNVKNVGVGIILIGFIATIIGAVLSPVSVPYWVINSSRVRIINRKNGIISLPGSFVRSIFKSLFGAGNIAVVFYFIYSTIDVVNDFALGINIAFIIMLLVFGAVGLGALIASVLMLYKGKDMLNNVLYKYEEKYEKVAISGDELVGMVQEFVRAEEKVEAIEEEVKPEGEKIEEERAEKEEPVAEKTVEETSKETAGTEETTQSEEE